jgi:hypothetical protein
MSATGKSLSIPRITALLIAAALALAAGSWVAVSFRGRPADLSGLHGTVFTPPTNVADIADDFETISKTHR